MGSFAASIGKNIDKMLDDIDKKCYEISYKLFTNVIYSTPVLRGNLINDWHTGIGKVNTTRYTQIDENGQSLIGPHTDITGAGSLTRVIDLKNSKAFYGQDGWVSMANSVPYAYDIEYHGWSERKAPQGMVRINLVKVAGEYK